MEEGGGGGILPGRQVVPSTSWGVILSGRGVAKMQAFCVGQKVSEMVGEGGRSGVHPYIYRGRDINPSAFIQALVPMLLFFLKKVMITGDSY